MLKTAATIRRTMLTRVSFNLSTQVSAINPAIGYMMMMTTATAGMFMLIKWLVCCCVNKAMNASTLHTINGNRYLTLHNQWQSVLDIARAALLDFFLLLG